MVDCAMFLIKNTDVTPALTLN